MKRKEKVKNNYYIICYWKETIEDMVHETDLHKFLDSKDFTGWWKYIPNTYIVSSDYNSKWISDEIIKRANGLKFLIMKVDIGVFNGYLPKSAWKWLSKESGIKIKVK